MNGVVRVAWRLRHTATQRHTARTALATCTGDGKTTTGSIMNKWPEMRTNYYVATSLVGLVR